MDRRNSASSVAKNQGALKIVWLALLLAMFAYTAVVFVFRSPEAGNVGENVRTRLFSGRSGAGGDFPSHIQVCPL